MRNDGKQRRSLERKRRVEEEEVNQLYKLRIKPTESP